MATPAKVPKVSVISQPVSDNHAGFMPPHKRPQPVGPGQVEAIPTDATGTPIFQIVHDPVAGPAPATAPRTKGLWRPLKLNLRKRRKSS